MSSRHDAVPTRETGERVLQETKRWTSKVWESTARGPASGPLVLVHAFVNTVNLEAHREDLMSPDLLDEWFARWEFFMKTPEGEERPEASRGDLERTLEVREALRALLWANNGAEAEEGATEVLDRAAADAGLRIRFGGEADTRLEPTATGVDGALGRILANAFAAMQDGTWLRLKACPECGWAFYDTSRNRSRTWCSMETCGNRLKTRAYQRRRRAGEAGKQ